MKIIAMVIAMTDSKQLGKSRQVDTLKAIFARSWGKFIRISHVTKFYFYFYFLLNHEDSMEVCDLSCCSDSDSDSNIDSDNEDHGIEDKDNRIGKDYVSSASVKGNLSLSDK